MRYMDGKVAAEEFLKKLLADPQLMLALKNRCCPKTTKASFKHYILEIVVMATETARPTKEASVETRDAHEFSAFAEAKLQATHRASYGSRERGQDAG